jgi:tetratricopeptide (TPR) repeat protein
VTAGQLSNSQSDVPAARSLLAESYEIYRELGDRRGVALVLVMLGNVAAGRREYLAARQCYEESLAILRDLGERGIASILNNLGMIAAEQGEYAASEEYIRESEILWRESESTTGLAGCLVTGARFARVRREIGRARELCEEGMALLRKIRCPRALWHDALYYRALIALDQGEPAVARACLAEGLEMCRQTRGWRGATGYLEVFVSLAIGSGDARRAARLLGAASALREAIDFPLTPQDRTVHEPRISAAQAALGEVAFDAAWTEGRMMTPEQAIDDALDV